MKILHTIPVVVSLVIMGYSLNAMAHTDVPPPGSGFARFIVARAKLGDAAEEAGLGYFYATGRPGFPKNYAKAIYWYKKSAAQRDPTGEANLGYMYMNGFGVPQNYKKAAYWSKQAAEKGNALGEVNLGDVYFREKKFGKSVYWTKKAAKQGNADAENNIGTDYIFGQGVPQNYSKAFFWNEKAAKQGYAEAEYNLGTAYFLGNGVTQSDAKATYWLQKSINQGYAPAKRLLQRIEHGSTPNTGDESGASMAANTAVQVNKIMNEVKQKLQ